LCFSVRMVDRKPRFSHLSFMSKVTRKFMSSVTRNFMPTENCVLVYVWSTENPCFTIEVSCQQSPKYFSISSVTRKFMSTVTRNFMSTENCVSLSPVDGNPINEGLWAQQKRPSTYNLFLSAPIEHFCQRSSRNSNICNFNFKYV